MFLLGMIWGKKITKKKKKLLMEIHHQQPVVQQAYEEVKLQNEPAHVETSCTVAYKNVLRLT